MIASFRISFSFSRLSEPPELYPEDYSEPASLRENLDHFLAYYGGEFELQIADRRLHFDLDPDLSTIFEDLPSVLERLTGDTAEAVYLDFFEQSTELMLILKRRGETITIGFETGGYTGRQFRDLPGQSLEVRASEFLLEWCRFAAAVLARLAELQPDVTTNAEFQDYRARLAAVAAQTGFKAD